MEKTLRRWQGFCGKIPLSLIFTISGAQERGSESDKTHTALDHQSCTFQKKRVPHICSL